jgi:hypothetical protein
MFVPALLVVFVLSPDPAEPTTAAFESASFEVLGPSMALRVEALAAPLADASALERAGAADGVVELSWDALRQSVLLHCYIASEQRWIDRTIRFGGHDSDRERGRLLGFAVASMFMGAPKFASARVAQQAGDVTPSAASDVVSPSVRDRAVAPPVAPRPAEPPQMARPSAQRALEFAGVVASGSSDTSGEVGALAAVRFRLSEPLWLRAQLSARVGEVPSAQSNLRRVLAGLGIAWSALPESNSVELGLRADALAGWLQIAHLSSDDVQRVHHHRWLLGGDAIATLGYRVSSVATLYAGLGMEAMLGRTFVYTHGVEVATERNLRGVAEVGFRTRF